MGTHRQGSDQRPPGQAEHGYRNEVSWDGGEGFQPYANQGPHEAEETSLGNRHEQGDAGEHAGVNIEQLEQVRGAPDAPHEPYDASRSARN